MMVDGTDRYEALGMPYPNVQTMCAGECEGTGVIPIPPPAGSKFATDLRLTTETAPMLIALWEAAERANPLPAGDIGWHFVPCPDCGGSGRARHLGAEAQAPRAEPEAAVQPRTGEAGTI